MEDDYYISAIAHFYQCDYALAKTIIKSAEENGTKADLDRIVYGNP